VRRAALAVLVGVLVASCTSHAPATPAATSSTGVARGPVYHISAHGTYGHPVTISNIVAGAPEYTLEAASVLYATDLRRGRFKDTTLYFYKGRKARLTVTAPTALADEVSHDVALSGGVHAITAAGVTLTSDQMNYDDRTRLLTAVGHVVAVEPGGNMLTGRRAIADLDLQQIQLFGEGPTGGAPRPTGGMGPKALVAPSSTP
jgi:LPS export ABC transporter protein LptC